MSPSSSAADPLSPTARGARPLERVRRLGALSALGLRGVGALLRPPFAWRRELLPTLSSALREATVPALVLVGACGAAIPGVQLGNFLANNGQIDRIGAYLTTTGLRWLGPVVAVAALAVAAGGPLTARLAHAAPEEDGAPGEALASQISSQRVAAHLAAFAVAAAVLSLVTLPIAVGTGVAVAALVFDAPVGVVTASMFDAARWSDVVHGVAGASISGALVGLVCTYCGLEVARHRQGEEGAAPAEARAVGEALVGGLAVVALVNVLLAIYLLAAFPDLRFTR